MVEFLTSPQLINIEVTDKCPLNCSQCYCKLNSGKEIDKDIALSFITEASNLNVKYINISGGETLLYPYLLELIFACSQKNIYPNIAISGWGFNKIILDNLIKNGVYFIFVSLNGSTEKINSLSRNGYNLAINTLDILYKSNFDRTIINWVMQSNNADDFVNMIALAEKYNAHGLVIMAIKPDMDGNLSTFPSKEQLQKVALSIKKYSGSIEIVIDKCFSQLKALIGRNIFSNSNTGLYNKGCTAGLDSITINVDGKFMPCRHLFIPESFDSISNYWYRSENLKRIRTSDVENNCISCKLKAYCRPCLAANSTTCINFGKKNNYCQLYLL